MDLLEYLGISDNNVLSDEERAKLNRWVAALAVASAMVGFMVGAVVMF